MKALAEKRLAYQAKKLLAKTTPFVIGVTGSVGKSSTKQAIGAVLGGSFKVRVSPGNYNTEFGLPLTILDLKLPKRSIGGWLKTLTIGCWRSTFPPKNYPDTLVLEMAADRPGDISKLVEVANPKIGVVTTVGESHLEFFGSIGSITEEKSTLVRSLPPDGIAVLNRDDERVWEMHQLTSAKVISFGFHQESDVRVQLNSVVYNLDKDGCGTKFKMCFKDSEVPVFIPGMFGLPAVQAALAGAAVGLVRGLNLVDIAGRFATLEPVPGRLRCLPGIKKTIVIDDSYNAAPKSVIAALDLLQHLPLQNEDDKRYVVLGDMLELGKGSNAAHVDVGRRVAELGMDCLVLVGELMGVAEKAALEAGMSEDQVFHFSSTEAAGRFLQERIKSGDAILVKGSRAMGMEKIVKELMAEPLRAADLLPGNHEEWRI